MGSRVSRSDTEVCTENSYSLIQCMRLDNLDLTERIGIPLEEQTRNEHSWFVRSAPSVHWSRESNKKATALHYHQ